MCVLYFTLEVRKKKSQIQKTRVIKSYFNYQLSLSGKREFVLFIKFGILNDLSPYFFNF